MPNIKEIKKHENNAYVEIETALSNLWLSGMPVTWTSELRSDLHKTVETFFTNKIKGENKP